MHITTSALVNSGNGTVTIRPSTPGLSINLGQSTDLIGGPLGLTDAELARITAGTLQIGDANSGPITVSAAITRSDSTNLSLISGSTISLPNAESQLATAGSGAISLTTPRNISLASGSSITTVDGSITLSANQQATPTSGNFVGVDVDGATIRVTGTGAVTVLGKGGNNSGGVQHGVRVQSSGLIEGGLGGLEIVGQGGASGTSGGNVGVYVDSAGRYSAAGNGSVTVQGTGGVGSGGANDGVRVRGSDSIITSSGGTVRVTGQGGGGGSLGGNYGVQVDSGAQISAGGTGSVIVHGTGGSATPGTFNVGVRLFGSALVSSAAGPVEIKGQGGGTGSSGMNYGVEVFSGRVTAGANGSIDIQGTGGAGSGNANHGVWITGTAEIITADGTIRIQGQGGGSGASGRNGGVQLQANVVAGGTGALIVQGTGGGGSGSNNFGVVANGLSVGSTVQITGIEGAGLSGTAIVATSRTISTAATGGALTLIGNSMDLAGSANITAGLTGTVTLKPYTPSVGINIGQPTDPSGGPLSLTSAELGSIAAGKIQIGASDSGPITIGEALDLGRVSYALLTETNVTFHGGGSLDVEINGPSNGTQFAPLHVTGAVALSGNPLNLALGYVPAVGDRFVILDNDATDNIAGIFHDWPEGSLQTVTTGDFSGRFLITYQGGDGNDVVLTVVNTAPTFVAGSEVSATDEDGARVIAGWATEIAAGLPNEAGQELQFVVTANTNEALFAAQPQIEADGNLTFTPMPNVEGMAQITVVLEDDGGIANGGIDASLPHVFTIEITKPHVWHNAAEAIDVSGDGNVVAADALAVINYINAFGAGAVPSGGSAGPPYLDVDGDNAVTANDALMIINHLNAFGPQIANGGGGEGESDRLLTARTVDAEDSRLDWLTLLSEDLAGWERGKRRR